MDFKPKKIKIKIEGHSEARPVPGETVCCLAGWSGANHIPSGPRGPRAWLVRLQRQQLATGGSALPSPKIVPLRLAGEGPRLHSKPGFKLEHGAGLDSSLEGCWDNVCGEAAVPRLLLYPLPGG